MSEARVIRFVALAGLGQEPREPTWLASFDVDAFDGIGFVKGTCDKRQAMRFPDAGAAIEAWRTQSTVRPLRPDGKANRPLTAYTIEIEPA